MGNNLKVVIWMALLAAAQAKGVQDNCTQLIVGIAPDWKSTRGQLQLFERAPGGVWKATTAPVPALFGKKGLAWGRGIEGQNEAGPRKAERDGRAPAGIFRIGKVYTYDAKLPSGADYPFHQVTTADAWVDDVKNPDYNRFVTIPDTAHPPPWFAKQKMRHNDFAYRWLLEIRHNADPPVSGAGSAIFFHIRRGVNRPSTGCTTMAEGDLVKIITWLRSACSPCYALLPATEYSARCREWYLPPPPEGAYR